MTDNNEGHLKTRGEERPSRRISSEREQKNLEACNIKNLHSDGTTTRYMRAPEPRRWDPNRSIIDTFRPDEHNFMEQLLILFSAAFLQSIQVYCARRRSLVCFRTPLVPLRMRARGCIFSGAATAAHTQTEMHFLGKKQEIEIGNGSRSVALGRLMCVVCLFGRRCRSQ